jgi:hypothetical protein
MTSGAKFDGRFNNDEFVYDSTRNVYICPALEVLTWRSSSVEKGMALHRYWTKNCAGCALKAQWTPAQERRLRRWMHEAVREEMYVRFNNAPQMMNIRKRTVKHPFGTLKQWMGPAHFLTRKLAGVSAEMEFECAGV